MNNSISQNLNLSGIILIQMFIICVTVVSFSQTISVPLSHWAYDAVERWEIQGIIPTVFNNSKPFTRLEMAEYIKEVWQTYKKEPERFSAVDLEQLSYLTLEFMEELEKDSKYINSDYYDLWHPRLYYLFTKTPLKFLNKLLYPSYRNFIALNYSEFNLFVDPILSYSIEQKMDEDVGRYELSRKSNGLLFYGNLGSYFGFYFDLTDNHLNDERWQGTKLPFEVWEESGWPYLTRRDNGKFEFDENVAYLSFNYKYFYLAYGREFNQWGVGHNGNLLLSTNSTVYDQIKFIVRYWRFKFTHVTAFLQYISPEARISIKSQPPLDQYWSGNRLELDLGKGMQLGFSEAVVYGDRSLQPGYFNPISFFKSVEHYYGDRDNGVLGIDFEWRVWRGAKLYGEWFIDDITTTKLGTNWYGNKFGLQAGIFFVNPFSLRNLDFLAEYSRIKPYVYSHSFQDFNKYKHYDSMVGHYFGPNSDQIFLRLRKRFSKFFMISLEYEKYRHGSNPDDRNVGGDPDHPWLSGDSPEPSFLDGILKTEQTYGVSVQYEAVRNFFLELHYRRMKFASQDWENLLSFRISLNFGYREQRIRHIFPVMY